jgi:hypothetical protein
MATVKGPFEITGSIKGVSFYTQRGSDKVIMRTKGGATKEKIARSPKFEKLRLNQQEWSGCVKMSRAMTTTFFELKRLADFNVSAAFNGIAKSIQKTDTENPLGMRSILFSRFRQSLDSYQLNRKYPLTSTLRISPQWSIDREKLQASITLPRINTETHLVNFPNLPYFRILITLGCLSDLKVSGERNEYNPVNEDLHEISSLWISPWYSTEAIIEEQQVRLSIGEELQSKLTDDVSPVLGIGIEFGKVGFDGNPVEVKYAGCAKLLGVK